MQTSTGSADGGFDNVRQTMVTQHGKLEQIYQKWLDRVTPLHKERWIGTGVVALIYIIRVLVIQGFYIVSYALGIYLLNILILFLSPKWDNSLEFDSEYVDDSSVNGPVLPVKSDDEFRPFVRRLPEFKFWHSTTKAFLIAFICTFFSIFDVPVFWPILLVYFIILFLLTMKRQIRHMIKHRYVPFTMGKKSYIGKK